MHTRNKIVPDEPFDLVPAERNEGESWVANAARLWDRRQFLLRVAAVALALTTAVAFLIPKQYESKSRIMPPEQQGGAAAMLAALAGRGAPTAMGALAGSLIGLKNTGALFVDLLQSRTILDRLVDKFDLQKVYSNRYRQDALKKLARRTDITEDRKSGVITIIVTDTDRGRARDMAQAYVDQLDDLVAKVNTSAARRERMFIEQRMAAVQQDLQQAERELSEFSSKNATLDIKEQTRAMVDAGAKLQAQMIVGESELDSLQQIYGDENVRVRAAKARVGELRRQLEKLGGTAGGEAKQQDDGTMYPPLRQLPILGVRWADLYRRVRVQETVFELLTQQYELARLEEARSIPTVRVIDAPNWPEKKSFPPRLLIMLLGTVLSVVGTSFYLLAADRWEDVADDDPRKALLQHIRTTLKQDMSRVRRQESR